LTACVTDGALSQLGSKTARGFLDGRDDVKSQFLGHCLKGLFLTIRTYRK